MKKYYDILIGVGGGGNVPSKPYFAKWLPVEGEGDTNCKWQWYNIQDTGWEDISRSNMDAIIAHGLKPPPQFRKLKLFLCSRDIQVGDKPIYMADGSLHTVTGISQRMLDDDEINKFGLYKVIGEISPDALSYVQEGQEFGEDEVELGYAAEVRKEYRNGEDKDLIFLKKGYTDDVFIQDRAKYWAEHINMSGLNYGYTLHWGDAFIHHVKIKGPCGRFH